MWEEPRGGVGADGGELLPAGGAYAFRPRALHNVLADKFIADHCAVKGREVAYAVLSGIGQHLTCAFSRGGHPLFTGLTCEHGQNCRAIGLNPWWTVFSEDVWRSARRVAATGSTRPRRAYPGPR